MSADRPGTPPGSPPESVPPLASMPLVVTEAAPPELAAAMAETRTVRDGYQALCREFGPSPQSGWSARISLTILNRHRVKAGLDAMSRTPSNNNGEDTMLRYRRERDEAREQAGRYREMYDQAQAAHNAVAGRNAQLAAELNTIRAAYGAASPERDAAREQLATTQALVGEILGEFKPGSPRGFDPEPTP